jgi:hypothetical protein
MRLYDAYTSHVPEFFLKGLPQKTSAGLAVLYHAFTERCKNTIRFSAPPGFGQRYEIHLSNDFYYDTRKRVTIRLPIFVLLASSETIRQVHPAVH